MKDKIQILVNFLVRAVIGMALIFFTNQFWAHKEIALEVGFNAVSFLTAGILGIPGVAMLYGIVAIPLL